MRITELTVYRVEELEERAQERAFNDWLQGFDYVWSGENRATLKAFCDIFPVETTNWEYGGGRCFINSRCSIEYLDNGRAVAEFTGVRLAKYIWNNYRRYLYKGKYYGISAPGKHKKRYSRCVLENCCVLTGYCIDEDILEPIYKLLDNPAGEYAHYTYENLLKECLENWVHAADRDFEYQTSFDAFKEDSEANDWEYDEHGRII